MLDPNQEVVNQTETAPVEQVAQQPEESQGQVATGEEVQQETSQEQGHAPSYEAVDETGVPYKNRYMETQRKLAELSDNLPKIIEETLAKKQQAPQVQEYTIEQLEQIAMNNPNLRPQVEAEKLKIYQRETFKVIEERDKKTESARQADVIRMRTEQEVLNDPAFRDCFVPGANGSKTWNMGHPLTQMVGEIMRNPELASRPDGLKIAADIAYGRYAREAASKSQTKAKVLQATLKKEQKKTMVEGGIGQNSQAGDDFARAKAELAKTGTKQAAQAAVLGYLKKKGLTR